MTLLHAHKTSQLTPKQASRPCAIDVADRKPSKRIASRHTVRAEPSSKTPPATAAAEVNSDSQRSSTSSTSPIAQFPTTDSSNGASGVAMLLSTPEQQSAAFGFLTVTSLAFGAAALAAPELLLSAALGVDGTGLEVAFTRIAGATMAISAAVEYSLQDAVNAGHLKSATYQKLMVAILAKNTFYLTAFLMSSSLWNPILFSFYPTAAAASIAINMTTLQSAFKQSGASSWGEGFSALAGFNLPKTGAGWAYSAFVVLYLATVAACYAPEVIFTGQPMTPAASLLKHTWAPGFVLAAGACAVLADAADRGRLGASTFRRLNLGLAVLEGGYTAVFGYSILIGLAVNDGSSWSNLVGSMGICLYCLYQYVATDKAKK